MNHFSGIVPDERWKNDLLNEIRRTNELLERLVERDAQALNQSESNVTNPPAKRKYQRRGA